MSIVLPGVLVLSIVLGAVPAGIVLQSGGVLVLDPERETLRCGKRELPFGSLRVPRVAASMSLERVGVEDNPRWMNVVHHVLEIGENRFFHGDAVPRKMVEDVADRLNSMLLEYYEREEVRTWLERRERILRDAQGDRGTVSSIDESQTAGAGTEEERR
jgi:hypothetical protein